MVTRLQDKLSQVEELVSQKETERQLLLSKNMLIPSNWNGTIKIWNREFAYMDIYYMDIHGNVFSTLRKGPNRILIPLNFMPQ